MEKLLNRNSFKSFCIMDTHTHLQSLKFIEQEVQVAYKSRYKQKLKSIPTP